MRIKKTKNPEYGYENKDELYIETEQHRNDVFRLMSFIALELIETGNKHDWSKIEYFDQFAQDTLERKDTPDFKSRPWYKVHTTEERHHLNANLPKDVDFIDVIEFICDCICSGYARDGEINPTLINLDDETLRLAFNNTIKKLDAEVEK